MIAKPQSGGVTNGEDKVSKSGELGDIGRQLAKPWARVLTVLLGLSTVIGLGAGVIFWVQLEAKAPIADHIAQAMPHANSIQRREFETYTTGAKAAAVEAKAERKDIAQAVEAIGRWQYGADEWKKAKAAP